MSARVFVRPHTGERVDAEPVDPTGMRAMLPLARWLASLDAIAVLVAEREALRATALEDWSRIREIDREVGARLATALRGDR